VVLVERDRVESELFREERLAGVALVQLVAPFRVEQPVGEVHPRRFVPLLIRGDVDLGGG
jgi:hypothetical protein